MVTTVTNNSPQSINTSLFSLDKEVQEVKKTAEALNNKLADINTKAGVISVNGKQGIVELTASDVKALPDTTVIPTTTSELTNNSGFVTLNDVGSSFVPVTRKVNNKALNKDIALTASDVGALPDTTVIPTTTGELTNNSGFVTINDVGSSFVPVTRKVNNKALDKDITLNATDVGALPDTTVIPTKTSQLTNDSGFVTFGVACPVGTILSGLYTTAPGGFLLCNGQEVAIADYPDLYAVIGGLEICKSSNAGMFRVPDFRECVLVGAGQNNNLIIKSHDVYSVGQFEDDQMQGHKHGWTGVSNIWSVNGAGPVTFTSGAGAGGAGFSITNPTSDGTNGTPRTGSTTHGKQIGITYIIKY